MISLLIILISQVPASVFGTSCSEPLLSKCSCGMTEYVSKQQYVVNCTNLGFNDTKPLEKLPAETQVLIFTGNNLPELPINIFGTENNNSHLKVVDMSNNKIKVIHGKAFHKVSTVERLILNHNDIAVDERHPRVFSNFESLLELHLTNAFADNSSKIASHLHLVFIDSDLSNLRKLHLEQNEIRTFKDPLLFCALNDLMDLHLGDNKLEHIRFKLDCLEHLRFMDLERNNIVYLTKEELSQLDEFPKRNQNFSIDFTDNPFSCGYQIAEFFSWLRTTSVEVKRKDKLKCKHEAKGGEEPLLLNGPVHGCHPLALQSPMPTSSNSTVTILSLLLVATVALLLYTNKEPIKNKLLPIFLSLSRKVHYTTIGKNEAHEMEV